MRRAVFISSITLLLLSFMFEGCSRDPRPLPTIKLGYAFHDHHSPLYIAALNPDHFKNTGGIYLKEITPKSKYHLYVNGSPEAEIMIERSTGGKELIRKLVERQFDMALGGINATLFYIDRGKSIKVVSPLMAEGTALVLSNSNPAENWHDFISYVRSSPRPIKIGHKIDISQEIILAHGLKNSGISFSSINEKQRTDIKFVNLYGAKNLIPALESGIVDGFVVNQPFPAMAAYRKTGKIVAHLNQIPPQGNWENHPCCVLDVHNDFYAKSPALVSHLATLLRRANQFITDNPGIAAEQVAKWLDKDLPVEKDSIASIKFVNEFDDSWHRGVGFVIEAMIDGGKINGEVKKAWQENRHNELIYLPGSFQQVSTPPSQ